MKHRLFMILLTGPDAPSGSPEPEYCPASQLMARVAQLRKEYRDTDKGVTISWEVAE